MNVTPSAGPAAATPIKQLLQQNGVTASLALIGPGEVMPSHDTAPAQDHLLFVVDGTLAVRLDELNFLLKKDQVLYVAKEKSESIRNESDGWAKVLRIDLPDRETTVAPIYSISDSSVFESEMTAR